MKYKKYEPLLISDDALEFKFISEGPGGKILKIVQFIPTADASIYNLAFGDLMPDGTVNDLVKNKDRDQILATIASIVYEFTSRNPDKFIFFVGSTPQRTRLYRMALTINFTSLETDFEIYGINLIEDVYIAEYFLKGKEYYGFLIKRRIH